MYFDKSMRITTEVLHMRKQCLNDLFENKLSLSFEGRDFRDKRRSEERKNEHQCMLSLQVIPWKTYAAEPVVALGIPIMIASEIPATESFLEWKAASNK